MAYDWDPQRLEYLKALLEDRGHRFEGFPLRCVGCGAMIGALAAMEEEAPACPRPAPKKACPPKEDPCHDGLQRQLEERKRVEHDQRLNQYRRQDPNRPYCGGDGGHH